jgi:hydrogenase maturation factor HypF (carbamoyltransferase family)
MWDRSAMTNILLEAFKPHKDLMNRRRPYEDFTCPKCGAHYKLVRMPAPADSPDLPLHCKICSQEFASTDEGNILKYFLVGRRPRRVGSRRAQDQTQD